MPFISKSKELHINFSLFSPDMLYWQIHNAKLLFQAVPKMTAIISKTQQYQFQSVV